MHLFHWLKQKISCSIIQLYSWPICFFVWQIIHVYSIWFRKWSTSSMDSEFQKSKYFHQWIPFRIYVALMIGVWINIFLILSWCWSWLKGFQWFIPLILMILFLHRRKGCIYKTMFCSDVISSEYFIIQYCQMTVQISKNGWSWKFDKCFEEEKKQLWELRKVTKYQCCFFEKKIIKATA